MAVDGVFALVASAREGTVLPRLPSSSRWEPVELMLVCFRETPLLDLQCRQKVVSNV